MTTAEPVAATPTLLGTKLHAPRPRRGIVARPRLADQLAGSALPAVTVVVAPAGFGKTTLLADACAKNRAGDCLLAWLSLDRSDNDPTLFWSYVIAAIQAAVADTGADAQVLLQSGQPAETVVASLLNDLAQVDDEIVIVLDDYHVIESAPIHEALTFAVEYLPPHVHLVLGARSDPPLPVARWRARGELLEIRAGDLRFNPDESAAYLNDQMGLALDPADVDALDGRTEGWIAALQLAALSLQGRDDTSGFITSFTGDDRFVVDYLAEEVLDRQPDDIRTFLLQTATMDRFTARLCDAVTDRADSKAMLDRLDRANLFLVPLDDRRVWYRYHHLFADVLRARLLDENPELVAVLHRRACDWYVDNDDAATAISHALAGNDVDRAAQLIEMSAPSARRHRQEATLRSWLESLPDDVFAERPVLAITLVGARMATGDTTGVEALLDGIESSLEQTTRSPVYFDDEQFDGLAAQVQIYRAALALLAGDLDATISHATNALALIEPVDHLRRGSATALQALAHWTAGDLDTAEEKYIEAIDALTAAGHLSDVLGCSLALADILIVQGRLSDASRIFEAGLRLTTEHPGLRGAADMHVGLSEVLIERNDLDGATRHMELSSALGETAGLPQHAYRWRVTQARLSRARGDLQTALELIEEAAPLYNTDFSPPVRPVAAIAARIQLASGDLTSANDWVTQGNLTAGDDLSYVCEYEHLTLARVLVAQHAAGQGTDRLTDALALLDRLLVAADHGGRVGAVIEILVVQAAAHLTNGDEPAATAALEDALRRAEPDGHLRLFLHAGPGVTDLLRSAATSGTVPSHAKTVLAAVDRPETPPVVRQSRPPGLIDELSPRELDVLRLLRSDLSGPEIASEMIVSLNTIRTHTKNIYMKLGVNNRREAIRRADELGL
jgi:LuxR family transcriptional regulator, maltose regulon positive regulatory protein